MMCIIVVRLTITGTDYFRGILNGYSKVSVLELVTRGLSFAQESHKKQRARVFPHMQMCLCIRTSPTSFVDISIYPARRAAEANLEDRTKFHEEVFGSALKDEFYYQGDIDYFFQAEDFFRA